MAEVYDPETEGSNRTGSNEDISRLRNQEVAGLNTSATSSIGSSSRGTTPSTSQGFYRPDEVKEAEESGEPSEGSASSRASTKLGRGDSPNDTGDDLYSPEGDNQGRFGKIRGFRGKTRNLANKLTKNKWLFGGIAGGSLGIVALLILTVLLIGSLKLPHFIENVTAYQFARVTRQMEINSRKITAEKLAIDAADDRTWTKIKQKYTGTTGKAGELHDKITSKYFPGKIAANYGQAEHFKPIYSSSSLFRGPRLVGVTLDNKTYLIKGPSEFQRFIPGINYVYDNKNAKALAPYLRESMQLDGYGPIVRANVSNLLRRELGIGLVAWGKNYAGKTQAQAQLQQARDLKKAVDKDTAAQAKTDDIKKAAEESKKQLDEDVKDDKKLRRILQNGGVDSEAVAKVERIVNSTGGLLKGLVSFISPVYSTALPVCLIYDGSLQNNGPNMDSQQSQLRRTGYYVNTAAGQQKDGINADPEAVGALNDQLGDITKSNSEIRAYGGTINTSGYISAQASPSGDYTRSVFDAFLGGTAGSFVNFVADNTCPAFTNVYAGIGLGITSVLTCAIPPGAACLGEQAAKEGAEKFLGRLAGKVVTKIANEQKGQTATALGGIVQKGAKQTGVTIGVVLGGTILARSIVYQHANQVHNGLQQNTDLANDVDNGIGLESDALMQRQFYGRPLTDSEAGKVSETDHEQVALNEKSKPLLERYASLSNTSSLFSRSIVATSDVLHVSVGQSIINIVSSLFQPLNSVTKLIGSVFTNPVLAEARYTSTASNYGNVRWGFSEDEINLIKNDQSYGLLANQYILDQSGNEDNIATKYGSCYDGTKKMGTMLADGDIKRSEDGNIIRNEGKCSPDNLSYNSPDEYAVDNSSDSSHSRDMIFRWRVAQGYNNSLDDLIDRQTITLSRSGDSEDSSADISSDAKAVAQEILGNSNISYMFSAKEDVTLISQGKPGTNGKPINTKALQIVAALGKKHKVVVSAYQSHGQGHSPGSDHYDGNAVDIAQIDGQTAYRNITDFYDEFKIYADGAVFLQGDCPGAQKAPAGMERKLGDRCNHQHISFN